MASARARSRPSGRHIAASGALLPANSSAETLTQILKVPTTAFEMANAITAVARDRTDTAARLALEEAGHRYLTRKAA